jgi:hypothetical protein
VRELATAVARFFEDSDVVLLGAPLPALLLSPTTVLHPPDTHSTQMPTSRRV